MENMNYIVYAVDIGPENPFAAFTERGDAELFIRALDSMYPTNTFDIQEVKHDSQV